MADTGPSRTTLVVLVVILLIAAGVGVWAANYYLKPRAIAAAQTAQVGDNVTVNYIGEYGNGTQMGKVFDTSLYNVSIDNATYPKSLQYTPHGPLPSAFIPLAVHVGPLRGSYVINNVNFTGVVTGFWQGMLGLKVNQTRWVTFPDTLGYGPLNPACTETLPLAFSVPVLQVVPTTQFSTSYPGVTPNPGVTFPDPNYKWSDLIFSMNSTDIVVESLTTAGYVAPLASGWNATVTAVNATTISLVNDLTQQNYGRILGAFPTGKSCGGGPASTQFTLIGVNPTAGTYTINWNSPVVGYSLTFRITLVQFVTA
jgi:hypothetical protein